MAGELLQRIGTSVSGAGGPHADFREAFPAARCPAVLVAPQAGVAEPASFPGGIAVWVARSPALVAEPSVVVRAGAAELCVAVPVGLRAEAVEPVLPPVSAAWFVDGAAGPGG